MTDDGYPFDPVDGPPVYSPDMGDTLYVNLELQNALREDAGLEPIDPEDVEQ